MAAAVKPVPEGFHTLTPHLVVRNAAEAIEFYKKAFGAAEVRRIMAPDGKSIQHAELRIGDSCVLLNDEFPDWGVYSPLQYNGTAVTLHLYVADADRLFQQAVEAGAQVVFPLADQFWGDRYGIVQDPYGHRWSIATRIKEAP